MAHPLGKVLTWLQRRAENVLAAMLAIMFVAFIIQIVFRYVLNFPIGWSSELSIITWLWGVLWGAAFVLKEKEEIRFDIIYGAAGRRTRQIMGIITGIAVLVLYIMAFMPSLDYVTFMKVQKTAYLKIRYDFLYSIFILFLVAVILRYVWIVLNLLRGKGLESDDSLATGSGR